MKKTIYAAALIAAAFTALNCRKPNEIPDNGNSETLKTDILLAAADHVIAPVYNDLRDKAAVLYTNTQALASVTDETNLTACKQSWRDCRKAWEQSEAFLFGPVSTENIDPRIDTWPVNFADLDSVLASGANFTAGFIDSLDFALRGFHPVEYLLFGVNGNKTASAFTGRELEYLQALAFNLQTLTAGLAASWDSNDPGSYYHTFVNAGQGSTIYSSQRAAYEELVNGMAGICEEVAGGKMSEPFVTQNPALEESPFAFNSISDFTDNIRGVRNMYLGAYTSDGKGIEDLVREYNLSLDSRIKQKTDAAIAALGTITVPFGQAISQQPVQVQNSIDAIEELHEILANELFPFIQQHTN